MLLYFTIELRDVCQTTVTRTSSESKHCTPVILNEKTAEQEIMHLFSMVINQEARVFNRKLPKSAKKLAGAFPKIQLVYSSERVYTITMDMFVMCITNLVVFLGKPLPAS